MPLREQILTSLACFVHCATGSATELARPYLMGAIGDSISAAALSSMSRPGNRPGNRYETGALGGPFDADNLVKRIESKHKYSWSTGNRIKSHAWKLREYLETREPGVRIVTLNAGKSGSKLKNFASQARTIAQEASKAKYRGLKYVTVLLGSNDLCKRSSPTPVIDMEISRKRLREGFAELAKVAQEERIRILVSSIPRIPDLAKPEINRARTLFGFSCTRVRDKWERACTSLLNWKTQAQYEEKIRVVEEMNSLLEEAAREAMATHPNLDIAFGRGFYEQPVNLNNLSIDCFHPDRYGQAALSQDVWKDQPWFH